MYISNVFPDDTDVAGTGPNFGRHGLGGAEGMEWVSQQWRILPLAVHSEHQSTEHQSAVHFVFRSSRNQSAGDKLHYLSFSEFSQGVLRIYC